jgi:Domain of unknown function (DUF5666)
MKMLIIGASRPWVLCSSLALAMIACKRSGDSTQDTAQPAQNAQAPNPDAPITLRGTVVSVSANKLVLKADTGVVTVTLAQPFHLYTRAPSDLSHVKESSFIGVTTVKQPDGSERATEIHVFPEELRGLGEGSRMMAPNAGAGGGAGRMTNGNVSASRMTNGMASRMTNGMATRMTNGMASPSRMSNGNVSSTNGTSLVVQYAGGSQNVTVPPNTPVTEFKIASRNLAAGDQVAVLVKKAPDGSLTAGQALSMAK